MNGPTQPARACLFVTSDKLSDDAGRRLQEKYRQAMEALAAEFECKLVYQDGNVHGPQQPTVAEQMEELERTLTALVDAQNRDLSFNDALETQALLASLAKFNFDLSEPWATATLPALLSWPDGER